MPTATVPNPGPRAAVPADLAALTEALTDAFLADPVMSWAFDQTVRERRLRAMWAFLAERSYLPTGDSTVFVDEAGSVPAAALWSRSDRRSGEAFWDEHGAEFAAALEGDLERLGTLSAVMAEHHPTEPHYYLLAIGVASTSQGRGLGTRLAAPTLERADAEGHGCYLEATSPRSRDLYRRWGFEVTAEFSAPGGPPLWAMWRPASPIS